MKFFDSYWRTVCGVTLIVIGVWLVLSNIILFGTADQIINNCCIIGVCLLVDVLTLLPTKSFMFKEIIKRKIENEDEELDAELD